MKQTSANLDFFSILCLIYLAGLVLNAIATVYIGYKAGDLKKKYAATIISFTFTSWLGIIMLCFTAAEWIQEQKARQRRFPQFNTDKNL